MYNHVISHNFNTKSYPNSLQPNKTNIVTTNDTKRETIPWGWFHQELCCGILKESEKCWIRSRDLHFLLLLLVHHHRPRNWRAGIWKVGWFAYPCTLKYPSFSIFFLSNQRDKESDFSSYQTEELWESSEACVCTCKSHGFCWCCVLHLYFVLFMICCSVRIMGNDTSILSWWKQNK